MSEQLPPATLIFKANNTNAVKGIGEIKTGLDGLSGVSGASGLDAVFSVITKGVIGVGVAAAAGLGIAAYNIKKAMDRLSELSKTAREVGVSANSLNQLNHVAKQFGVDAGTIGKALETLHDKFPKEDAIAALMAVREEFQALPPGVDAAVYAQDMFGSSAEALYPLLTANNEEFKKYTDQAKNFQMSDMGIAQVEDAHEAMKRLGNAWDQATETFWNQLAIKVAPMITWLADKFESWAADTEISMSVVNIAWEWFTWGLEKALNVTQVLVGVFKMFFGFLTLGFGGIVKGLSFMVKGIEWVVQKITGLHSTLGESMDRFSDATMQIGMEITDSGVATLQDKWWGDKFRDIEKEAMNTPVKKRRSFGDEEIPESLRREQEKKDAVAESELPKALLKNSEAAQKLMNDFRSGKLVEKENEQSAELKRQTKQLEDVNRNLERQREIKQAKF